MLSRRRQFPAILEWAAALASLVLVGGCTGDRAGGPAAIDSVQLKLSFGGGVTLNNVDYVLTGPNNYRDVNTLPVGDDPSITTTFTNLPVGNGYKIVVQGTGSDNASICKGQTMFNVVSMMNAVVQIALMCTGRASVTADVNNCPTIESLSVAPAEVYVGTSVQLESIAQDPDNGPTALMATWAAASGSLTNLSSAGATFTCTEPGTFKITLTVSDGTPAMKCTDSAFVNVVCTPGGG